MTLSMYSTPKHQRQKTILLVEDEPFVREATQHILERAGFHVLGAEDISSAHRVFAEHCVRVDLVMTDMVLPGGTGQQLAHDLHLRHPEVTVLVTSGYTDAESLIENPESKIYFLAKPYSRSDLMEKLATILGPQQFQSAAKQAG